jgi:cytochrome c oxidase subunit 2
MSAVDPAGPQAARIATMTWYLTIVGTAVFLVTVGFLLYALWRGHRRVENYSGDQAESHLRRWVIGATAITGVILAVTLVYDFATGRALANFAEPDALVIRVTGHQWWWQAQYIDPLPSNRFETANEIHIPVGRRVRIEVGSGDVIHSFWVPNLHGKVDLIPGYTNTTYFRADRAGIYHGRCAEFCGYQHARMDFLVIADPPREFEAWYRNQLRAAPSPADSVGQAGQQVFLSNKCAMCHAIRGTEAGSHVGPDLTHLASRRTIAAGVLPNTRGPLAGWVLDPQSIKPGVYMPPNQMKSDELHALLSYLESLK